MELAKHYKEHLALGFPIVASTAGNTTYQNVIDICPADDEVAGLKYKTVADAQTYLATQSPSATNLWAIRIYGTNSENINIGLIPFVHYVGVKDSTILTGQITSSVGAMSGSFSGDYVIRDCNINNLILGTGRYCEFYGCDIFGGTLASQSVPVLFNCTIKGGTWSLSSQDGLFFPLMINSWCVGSAVFNGGIWFNSSVLSATINSAALNIFILSYSAPDVSIENGQTMQAFDCFIGGDITLEMGGTLSSANSSFNNVINNGGTWDTEMIIEPVDFKHFKQISTPSDAYAGYNKLYFKSDDKLYKLDSNGNEVEVGGGGGSGDVVGPSSAVDENIAVFDTTTGKLIKDGGVVIDDLLKIDQTTQQITTGIFKFPKVEIGGDATASDSTKMLDVKYPFIASSGTDAYVKLLLHANGTGNTFVDDSASVQTITPTGNVTQSTTKYKFGGKSAYFDGAGSYLTVSDSADFDLGTDDFTIDLWINTTTTTNYAPLFIRQVGGWGTGQYNLMINNGDSGGKIAFWVADYSLGSQMLLSTTAVNDGNQHHVAVIRNGTSWKLYIDGISESSYTGNVTIGDITAPIYIGLDTVYGGRNFDGYLDEIRFSKGIARWTTNFIPPTAQYGDLAIVPTDALVVDSTDGNTNVKKILKLSGATSGFVGLKGADVAGSTVYTLPAADGSSGQVLSTDASGVLSWATRADHDALTLGAIGSTPKANGSTISGQVLNLEPANETYGGVVSTAEQSFSGLKKFQGGIQIGSGNDHADFSNKGFPTLAGDAQGKLTLRPNLVQSRTKISSNKPTEVLRGCNIGYSFPIYNNDDEELFFRMRIPARWDGTTDPQVGMMCTITGAEDVGDKFKFQLEWQTTDCGGDNIMGTATSNCVSEQTIITGGGTAHTAYCVFFNLDASDATNPIVVGDMLQCRLRRIAASANEVSNEVAVWDWIVAWRTSKVFGVYSVESNVS